MNNLNHSSLISDAKKNQNLIELSSTFKNDEDDRIKNYFIISYEKKKTDSKSEESLSQLEFSEMSNIPECLYTEKKMTNEDKIEFRKVFKYAYEDNKNLHYFKFKFEIDKEYYEILYGKQKGTFIFDLDLKMAQTDLLTKKTIDQNHIKYYEKMELFIAAINENESELLDKLLDETISLYTRYLGFDFFISIFVKVAHKKTLYEKLIKVFKAKINNEKNMDRKENLKIHKDTFLSLIEDADNIIKENEYDPTDFKGIILIYLNYYDPETFKNYFSNLLENEKETLYNILLTYYFHFKNPINTDEFLSDFIKYSAQKDFKTFLIGCSSFVDNVNIFLEAIDKCKETLILNQNFEAILIPKNTLSKNIEVDNVTAKIDSLIKFSEENKKLIVIFAHYFWKILLKYMMTPTIENIKKCSELNRKFEKYYKLVFMLYQDKNYDKNEYEKDNKKRKKKVKNKRNPILEDADKCYKENEFGFAIDQMVNKFIQENENLKGEEILNCVMKYNTYYKEDKHIYKRNLNIFDKVNLDEIGKDFTQQFKEYKFEEVFKKNIYDYLSKLTSKISTISQFDIVINLINIKNLKNVDIFLNLLDDKYKSIVKNSMISSLNQKEKTAAISTIANIANLFYMNHKNVDFLSEKIVKLDKKIIPFIYIELIKKCNDYEHEKMKKFIFDKFISNIKDEEDIENTIAIIKILKENDRIEFYDQLSEKYTINEDDFYSSTSNIRIKLLCTQKEKDDKLENKIDKDDEIENIEITKDNDKSIKLLEDNNNYFQKCIDVLQTIFDDINKRNISKERLDSLLANDKKIVIRRLDLLKLLDDCKFGVENKFDELSSERDRISKTIKDLNYIKDELSIFHKESYTNELAKIDEITKRLERGEASEFDEKMSDEINKLLDLQKDANKVNKVKDLVFFQCIYDETQGNNSKERFEDALNVLSNIDNSLKSQESDELSTEDSLRKYKEKLFNNDEKQMNELFKQFRTYFDLGKDEKKEENKVELNDVNSNENKNEKVLNNLKILVYSKIYETDVNSIFYFFDNFDKTNEKWNEKLPLKYKDLSLKSLKELKESLNELQKSGIYDYTNKSNYIKFFTYLYGKKEAIDFLRMKPINEIQLLTEKLDPTDTKITEKDIDDTRNCVGFFSNIKKLNDNCEIFQYLKDKIDDKTLKEFENFSNIYPSIIELNENFDLSVNLYVEVNSIIEDAFFKFEQDREYFKYKDKMNNVKETTIQELMNLKNKIPTKKIQNVKENNKISENLEQKNKKLVFFKDLIKNIEIIYDEMNSLRSKGSSLPIQIEIKIKYPTVKYKLKDEDNIEFIKIKNFLSDAEENLKKKLDEIYKDNPNLRFIYGKQFNVMERHINGDMKIDSFLRYILNNESKEIKEGNKGNSRNTRDYYNDCDLYSQNTFDNIDKYIRTLFINNGKTLEKHYEKMLIKKNSKDVNDENREYKGIYLYSTESKSMEEEILKIFMEKIGDLPIAQNVLISNKETSYEEMEAFFHRSILCEYNTLFVVEINDSFSVYQQGIMNNFINKLLKYQNNKYKNIDIRKTSEYINSCIIFIYNPNKCNDSVLIELQKLETEKFPTIDNNLTLNTLSNSDTSTNNSFYINYGTNSKLSLYDNTHIVSSSICGLGKTTKIHTEILNKNKKYYYFPLGGDLTKNIIYKKLNNILSKIKTNDDYKDIALHVDLFETEDDSILNEFFFSLLITKFYSNNENIIYIPKVIEIYVEIPNCFKNFMSKYGILSSFDNDNITFEKIPPLILSPTETKIVNRMNVLNPGEKIEDFIRNNMGAKHFSYHQVKIFIALLINQYGIRNSKITFWKDGVDVTKDCIKQFVNCIKYFTLGSYSKILTDNELKESDDPREIISQIYDNDLKKQKYKHDLIFISKNKPMFKSINLSPKGLEKYKTQLDFLKVIKDIYLLENPISTTKDESEKKSIQNIDEEEQLNTNDNSTDDTKLKSLKEIIEKDNYVITRDNFKKMLLIIYRIMANIPVILMGETGSGKTALVRKLSQLLNNGKESLEIVNIDPGITDKKLAKKMAKINKRAQKEKELWVFFDEFNTCNSLALITEIFINRTFNGVPLNKNIRLIGACNPCRKRRDNEEQCGLRCPTDNNELVYLVKDLPQSLMYYVFNFGSINKEDEKQYIFNIISEFFKNNDYENKLRDHTKKIIFECHNFLQNTYGKSVVSLRELSRFTKCCHFLMEYFKNKRKSLQKNEDEEIKDEDETNYRVDKLKSIIDSVYLCYYIRLAKIDKRSEFEIKLKNLFIDLVNCDTKAEENINDNDEDINNNTKKFLDKINEPMKSEIQKELKNESFECFSDLLGFEEKFLLDQIELDKGIGHNKALGENTFLLFLSLITNIPLIIIGKPGSGKSLSAQLINKSMRGKYSESKFFKLYPRVVQTYFQGSESTTPEEVENLFKTAEGKMEKFITNAGERKEDIPIIMILFDELGLAEKSQNNPLKVLHSKLEYDGNKKGISFVGISNWSLDAAKLNRALRSSVPDLDENAEDLIKTSKSIVKSINTALSENQIFSILIPNAHFNYKKILTKLKKLMVYKIYIKDLLGKLKNLNKDILSDKDIEKIDKMFENNKFDFVEIKNLLKKLNDSDKQFTWNPSQFEVSEFKRFYYKEQKIKVDFHTNRDFFNLVKLSALELSKYKSTDESTFISIIEKYIERNYGGMDIEIDPNLDLEIESEKTYRELLKEILKTKSKKISSVYLFKKIFNFRNKSQYYIKNDNLIKYDLNRAINDNINNINNRYLLLEIKSSLTTLILQNLRRQNPYKNITYLEGSPFINDSNNEYKFKIISDIQELAKNNNLIILKNLKQILAFLYDLFNMNFVIKDKKKYARICMGNFSDQLTFVNDKFRCIIIVDKEFVGKLDPPFLSRFEKQIITFDKLLDVEQKNLWKEIRLKINLKKIVENIKEKYKINYNIKNLLINCDKENIQGLIYYYYNKEKNKKDEIYQNSIKEKIYNKIYKTLPQDIIINLPDNNVIKENYCKNKNIYNLKNYLDFLSRKEGSSFKISIVYTFTNISNIIEGIDSNNNTIVKIISEVKSENELKNETDKIIEKNEDRKFIIIRFNHSNSKMLNYIISFIMNNYQRDKNKFILIVHLKRNFNTNEEEKTNKKSGSSKDGKIYSQPDVDECINQIFIDNLNGKNLPLEDILNKSVETLLNNNKETIDLSMEFNKTLNNYINKKLYSNNNLNWNGNHINKENYKSKITKYFEEKGNSYKEEIIKRLNDLIGNDLKEEAKNLIPKIFEKKYINKNSVDIISVLIDYVKEEIFNKYLVKVFDIMEDNNVLSTLLALNESKSKLLNEDVIKQIHEKYLKTIKLDFDKTYNPKFILNFVIPGFYNFYKELSDLIKNNFSIDFYQNEQKLREYLGKDVATIENNFHNKEEEILSEVIKYVKNNEFIMSTIDKIPLDLLFEDYITYYLQKYKQGSNINDSVIIGIDLSNNKIDNYSHNDIYHQIIQLLVKLRFKEDYQIIKKNNTKPINKLLLEIIWIESNINHIINILKIYDYSNNIFPDNENNLFELMKKEITDNKLKYITNIKTNPEHTFEVNECYYILLASICLGLTSPTIKLVTEERKNNRNFITYIYSYFSNLAKILKIIQIMNDDLYLYLNEMYIIDELVKIYQDLKKCNKLDIEKLTKIKEIIRKSAIIIQTEPKDKIEKLIAAFDDLFELIENMFESEKLDKKEDFILYDEKNINENEIYCDLLKFLCFKETKKIVDINYRTEIFTKIITKKDIIKKSNDIFQILVKGIISPKKGVYTNSIKNLLNEKKEIFLQTEKTLSDPNNQNVFALSETLLYFFEKNSINYLKNFFNDKKDDEEILLEKEPLDIFKECIQFLEIYRQNINSLNDLNRNLCKYFCLGYIRVFLYSFIKIIKNGENNKLKNPKLIIESINSHKKDNPLKKMLRLYVYKIIYYKNNKEVETFMSKEKRDKYYLNEYCDFSKFIEFPDNIPLDFGFISVSETNNLTFYDIMYKRIEEYRKEKFEEKVKKTDIDLEKYGFDNFYRSTCCLILSYLKLENFYKQSIFENFYKNVCVPLFKDDDKMSQAIQILYNPKKFESIKKKFNINSEHITILLYGYRYFINDINSNNDKGIYSSIYNNKNIDSQLFPGNDIPNLEIYELYTKIKNHFNSENSNDGCYICLCSKYYYHSIPGGFPSRNDVKKSCPKCHQSIGAWIDRKNNNVIPVKRPDYFRIFKDQEEMKREMRKKGNECINTMLLEDFERHYIYKRQEEKSKGITKSDENHFKKTDKIIRDLSQVSYRLLNFILYSHLFFARVLHDNVKYDSYLPSNMSWMDTLNECWILLKNELSKKNINSIEIFMNYVFCDVFKRLNLGKQIFYFKDLMKIENKLDGIIQMKITGYHEEEKRFDKLLNADKNNIFSCVNLLNEIYDKSNYNSTDYPFYENFYFSYYLDEDDIRENILKHMEKNKYPLLYKYLNSNNEGNKENDQNNKQSKDKKGKTLTDNFSLKSLDIFNSVLNLFNEEYLFKIKRESAEEKLIESEKIYIENKESIDKFISFFNSLKIPDSNKNILKLSVKSPISDFLIDDNNEFGKSYKEIYKRFIDLQNKEITDLLDVKIEEEVFDCNCKQKIRIQNIKKSEIFIFNLPKKFSFINILFNNSYRKIIDNNDYKAYNQYKVSLDFVEDNLTEYLLKNKKLLDETDTITNFVYKNEEFNLDNIDIVTTFNKKFEAVDLTIDDKIILYKFCTDNKEDINLMKNLIDNFSSFIISINSIMKNNINNNEISGETKIKNTFNNLENGTISEEFKNLFKDKDNFTIEKLVNIFGYFLELIFETIKKDINDYQIELQKEQTDGIKSYFKQNEKELIKQKNLSKALRLLMTLVLFKEDDKENKIKQNKNNIVNYLNISDLWDENIYKSDNFGKKLNEIKKFNVQINQILKLYDLLGGDIEEDAFNDVKEQISKNDEMNKQQQNIKQDNEEENEEDDEEEEKEEENTIDNFYRYGGIQNNDSDNGREDDE